MSALSQVIALDPAYRQRADRLQQFLLTQLSGSGRLMKSMAQGRTLPDADLAGYAYVVQGLLDHADATGNGESRKRAKACAQTARERFRSNTGWKREARPLLATLQPDPVLADGALDSPSDVLILDSLRLRDTALNRLARGAACWRLPEMEPDPVSYPAG